MLGSAIDSGEVLGELAARTLEECDYTREAANQQLFRRLWASHPMSEFRTSSRSTAPAAC